MQISLLNNQRFKCQSRAVHILNVNFVTSLGVMNKPRGQLRRGGYQMIILLNKPYLVKVTMKEIERGGKNAQKADHVVYG